MLDIRRDAVYDSSYEYLYTKSMRFRLIYNLIEIKDFDLTPFDDRVDFRQNENYLYMAIANLENHNTRIAPVVADIWRLKDKLKINYFRNMSSSSYSLKAEDASEIFDYFLKNELPLLYFQLSEC